jgi:hypothetical protein
MDRFPTRSGKAAIVHIPVAIAAPPRSTSHAPHLNDLNGTRCVQAKVSGKKNPYLAIMPYASSMCGKSCNATMATT